MQRLTSGLRFITIYASLLMLPLNAGAHLLGGVNERTATDLWQFDPVALFLLAVTAFWYRRGSLILRRRNLSNRARFRRKQYYFWFGWISLLVALGSPIDALGEWLFSVHMVQHELLMIAAGPLLVLSRPSSALMLGMGKKTARTLIMALDCVGLLRHRSAFINPASAWTIHALGLWGWHIPYLFNASLNHSGVHTAQHISFLCIALIFWYSLTHIQKSHSVVGMVYLFSTAVHASLLGALLTFSPVVWYEPYIETAPLFGLTGLQDQQLGGLIMWMPAGIVFIGGALLFLARLMPNSGGSPYESDTYHD